MESSEFAYDVGAADFDEKVVAASHRVPVVVDFWAPWCGPCRSLKPILEKLADEYAGRFLLARLNSDEAPDLSRRYQVRSIPSVKAFRDGVVIDEFVGALPESAVREFLDRLQPQPADLLRSEAAAHQAAGNTAEAQRVLLDALQLAPRHEGVRLDLAALQLASGALDAAATTLDFSFADEEPRAQTLRTRLALARDAGDVASLAAAVSARPQDPAARIALAKALAAGQDYRRALAELLVAVRLDRNYADQLARRTMLQLFDLLADEPGADETVREYRRALSAALN